MEPEYLYTFMLKLCFLALFTQQLHPSTNRKVPASLPSSAALRGGGAVQRSRVADRSCANGHREANGSLHIGQHQY